MLIQTDRLKHLHDFFPELEKQLRRRGMTVSKQYDQYKLRYPDGYGLTSFFFYYNHWRKKVNPVMHIEHKIGDKMYVDYAGATLPYVDTDTGEIKQAQVFAAILGWSQYAYIEAVPSQTVEDSVSASENALHYFKGVPLALVPDNLKSAVIKTSKYEPVINENFGAFAEHYNITVLPARARKPQDKAHVENLVKLAYKEMYTTLPEGEVFTLEELNTKLWEALELFNSKLLSGKQCSRKDQWIMEQASLHTLPETRFEMRQIRQVTVMKNGHVYLSDDKHYYSVPYQLIGKKLRIHYSRSSVQIFQQYELVASHPRLRSAHNYSTNPSHMPSQHRYVAEWNPELFMEKARAIAPVVETYIREVLNKKQYPEQAYKSCQGILSFANKAGHERLIKACERAHEIGFYNYKIIEGILKKNLDGYDEEQIPTRMPDHGNIRGGNYYQ